MGVGKNSYSLCNLSVCPFLLASEFREKEKADVDNIEQPSVRAFLKQQGTWEQKFNKEQQEYLDALNRQEVAEKVRQLQSLKV